MTPEQYRDLWKVKHQMNTEQQQLDTDALLQRLVETPAGERIRMKCGAADLRSVITDALSIVKGQEAGNKQPVGWVSCGLRSGRDDRIVDIVFENADCAKAFIDGVAPSVGPVVAATSMRSLCVEKVKSVAAKYEREQFAEAGNQRIVEKTRLDTANEIIKELESLSIQEQKS